MKILLSLTVLAACAATHPTTTTPNEVDPILAVRRAQMIQWLHEYDVAGVYPTDDTGMPLSVFQDARGVRCPMAELMHRSGRDDLVAMVVHANNALRLAEVHDGPLYDWMTSSGLTHDEIAMVQGAMSFDTIKTIEQLDQHVAARGEVHGHLETAQVALRVATAQALPVAARERAAARTRQAVKTTLASLQSSGTTR
ncbi:MAG TPA: hypothetical protein VMJ10_27975 [Kofleriaceae bacterium]|nr:hypothetical protein [Kofleriaceae bacterium]